MKTAFILAAFWAAIIPVKAGAPLDVDSSAWKQQAAGDHWAIFHTYGTDQWQEVSPPGWREIKAGEGQRSVGLSALDFHHAWLAVLHEGRVEFTFTSDAGKTWVAVAERLPVSGESIALSFLNEREGVLLCTSSPAAGLMQSALFRTSDGAKTWQPLPALPEGNYYPSGLAFRSPQEGWLIGSYHGQPNVPFFHTTDGGQTWQRQPLPIPGPYRGGYADLSALVFSGPDRTYGKLTAHFVRHAPPEPGESGVVQYETNDGGQTWVPDSSYEDQPNFVYSPNRKYVVAWFDTDLGMLPSPVRSIILQQLPYDDIPFSRVTFPRLTEAYWSPDSKKCLIIDAPDNGNTDTWLFSAVDQGEQPEAVRISPLKPLEEAFYHPWNGPTLWRPGITKAVWKDNTTLELDVRDNLGTYLITVRADAPDHPEIKKLPEAPGAEK